MFSGKRGGRDQFMERRGVLIAVVIVCLLVMFIDWVIATSAEAFVTFLGTLVATFAGVGVAAYLNVLAYDRQERQRTRDRDLHERNMKREVEDRLARSLAAEAYKVLDIIRAEPANAYVADPSGGASIGVIYAQLIPTATEEAIKVGLLGHRDVDTQSQNLANLSQLASLMREYTKASEDLKPLVVQWQRGDTSVSVPAYNAAKEADRMRQNLETWCPPLLERLRNDGVNMPPDPWYRSDGNLGVPYST